MAGAIHIAWPSVGFSLPVPREELGPLVAGTSNTHLGAAKCEFGGGHVFRLFHCEYGEIQPQIFPYLQIRAVFGVPVWWLSACACVVLSTYGQRRMIEDRGGRDNESHVIF